MTQREELNADQKELNWLLGLEKETLADMVLQQSKIIKKLQNTEKAQVVPEWWRLVPVEPTKEMFAAGYDELENSESIELIYKRMISASPACGGSSKWISVGERLPAYGDDCLIVGEGKSEPENIVYEFTKDKFSSEDQFVSIPGGEDYFYARNVSHWMPLPAAPEQTK